MIVGILVKLTTCEVKDYASYGPFITSKQKHWAKPMLKLISLDLMELLQD